MSTPHPLSLLDNLHLWRSEWVYLALWFDEMDGDGRDTFGSGPHYQKYLDSL